MLVLLVPSHVHYSKERPSAKEFEAWIGQNCHLFNKDAVKSGFLFVFTLALFREVSKLLIVKFPNPGSMKTILRVYD
jgi:hypothetical protein